ncbi:hypothetical protein KNE206_21490 [Kitasatospora sp. NE20-6]
MCISDATEEEKPVTRLDSARDTAGRTKDAVAPYAANAKEAALYYADEARQRFGPAIEALGPKAAAAGAQARSSAAGAAQTARIQYTKHVVPQLENAFAALPPQTQQSTLKAVHRAQEAALAAKLSAEKAAEQARAAIAPRVGEAVAGAKATVVPAAQEAQVRGAAAIAALHGHVTSAEIGELAAKNIRKENRNGWATGLAVTGAVALGAGVFAWQWYRKQNNPEWLTEPPATTVTAPAQNGTGAHPTGAGASTATNAPATPPAAAEGTVNGSVPHDQPSDGTATGTGTDTGHATAADTDSDRPKPHDPRKPH